jgi:hypothetical protein
VNILAILIQGNLRQEISGEKELEEYFSELPGYPGGLFSIIFIYS